LAIVVARLMFERPFVSSCSRLGIMLYLVASENYCSQDAEVVLGTTSVC
jgi:hypothetical protein